MFDMTQCKVGDMVETNFGGIARIINIENDEYNYPYKLSYINSDYPDTPDYSVSKEGFEYRDGSGIRVTGFYNQLKDSLPKPICTITHTLQIKDIIVPLTPEELSYVYSTIHKALFGE